MTTRLVIAATILLGLAACGGGGATSGAPVGGLAPAPAVATPVVVQPAVATTSLGTRGVPGGAITVTQVGTAAPGAPAAFRLALGALAPARVLAWIGAEGDLISSPGVPAVPTATAGTWEVTLVLPAPLVAGSHVWVRLEFADGAVIETGADDFRLTKD